MPEHFETRKIQYEGNTITYSLIRKPVRNINLRINNSGNVRVSANMLVSTRQLDAFVLSHAQYILKFLREHESAETVKELQLETGEVVRILGQDTVIKVLESISNKLVYTGNELLFYCKKPEDFRIKSGMYKKWLRGYTEEIFGEISRSIFLLFRAYNITYPEFRYRSMRSRWGSCQPVRKIITLNTELISKKRECIEYVVLHEFAHFIEANHSKRFYAVVAELMPDWKQRKKALNN